MPVSRNLSLPSSIENRNKRRPDTLSRSNTEVLWSSNCTIQRSKPVNLSLPKVSRPCFLLPTTKNYNNNNDVLDENPTPRNESNEEVAETPNPNKTVMGVDCTATRGGTLSQPCLSLASPIRATQIFPHLFLGSQKDVVDEKMMRSNGITYVLNVSKTCTKPDFIDDGHFHRISVRDSYQEKITPHMLEAVEFIEKVRKSNQRVIVHCLAGVSRSATVAIAYVLHYLRISFEEAYRFVKEKRPSISPNFNFLGQLMEFENSLKMSGHFTCKSTGSLSEDSDDEQAKFHGVKEGDSLTALKLDIFGPSEYSPRVMPATCSFQCSTEAAAPRQSACGTTLRSSPKLTSSLRRRRNGPTFCKDSFMFSTTNSNNNSCSGKCDSPMPKFLNGNTPFGNPAVVVGLRVEVPQTPRVSEASRRLGSDGFEKYENMSSDTDSNSCSSDAFSPMRNQEAVPEQPEQAMDCSENGNSLADDEFAKLKEKSEATLDGPKSGRCGQLTPPKNVSRHRRCASGGGINPDILQSPFNMKRRFEARTERSSSIGELIPGDQSIDLPSIASVKRGSSFSGSYYDQSTTSSRSPHKFISINSRSPKILRKSHLQLNLRPVYTNNQQKGTAKSEDAAAPISTPSVLSMDTQAPVFDCSHSMSGNTEPLRLNVFRGCIQSDLEPMKEGTTPEPTSDMSTLTLSSPSVDKAGSPIFPSAAVKSPATCPVLIAQRTDPSFARNDSPTRFMCKESFPYTSKTKQLTDSKTSQTFLLTSSCDLKPKWRSKGRRRQSADSGYLSSQASSQSSSSFTSPTSQQMVFGSGSPQQSFAEVSSPDGARTSSPVTNTCHVEGAFVTPDDVTNSNSDPDGRKTNVRQRNAVEIMSCS